MPQQIFKEFAQLDQVEAIVLGGSPQPVKSLMARTIQKP